MALALTPDNLTFENIEKILGEKPLLELPPGVYGANLPATPTAEQGQLARVYLQTHAVSFGPAVPEEVIRLALALLLFSLVRENGGPLAPLVIKRLLAFYNREVFPVVQQQGSPVSQVTQLCLPLLAEGKVSFQGYGLNSVDVNNIFSWEPIVISLPEANYLVNQPVFTYAETAYNIIKLQPLLLWLDYLLDTYSQIATDQPLPEQTQKLAEGVNQIKNIITESVGLPAEKQNLGLLRDALLALLTEIKHLTGAVVDYITEALENLFSSAEPPATAGFVQASALVQSLQKQLALVAPSPTEVVFTRADIKILNRLLGKALVYGQELISLAFWSIAQVGKVYNLTPGNLILSTYYHSPLFVPKEMVSDQLEKVTTFIRNTSPNPVS